MMEKNFQAYNLKNKNKAKEKEMEMIKVVIVFVLIRMNIMMFTTLFYNRSIIKMISYIRYFPAIAFNIFSAN